MQISNEAKGAILDCLANAAYAVDNAQALYDALVAAFYPVSSISAVYTQSGTVTADTALSELRTDLVVTATYEGGSSEVVTGYTLSGTLTAGTTSTITVTYAGKTTTFNVVVAQDQYSGDTEWYDGKEYRNLTVVANEYVRSNNGTFAAYNGWSRTGFVYCEGASTITFPPMPDGGSGSAIGTSNAWYTSNDTATRISNIAISKTQSTTVNVPANAKYFAISSSTDGLASCIAAGIVPHA